MSEPPSLTIPFVVFYTLMYRNPPNHSNGWLLYDPPAQQLIPPSPPTFRWLGDNKHLFLPPKLLSILLNLIFFISLELIWFSRTAYMCLILLFWTVLCLFSGHTITVFSTSCFLSIPKRFSLGGACGLTISVLTFYAGDPSLILSCHSSDFRTMAWQVS